MRCLVHVSLMALCTSCTLILHSLLCWSCSSQCEFTGTALFFCFFLFLRRIMLQTRWDTTHICLLLWRYGAEGFLCAMASCAMSSKPYRWRQMLLVIFSQYEDLFGVFVCSFPLLSWKKTPSLKLRMIRVHLFLCCEFISRTLWLGAFISQHAVLLQKMKGIV